MLVSLKECQRELILDLHVDSIFCHLWHSAAGMKKNLADRVRQLGRSNIKRRKIFLWLTNEA